ncbi:MAG TPA: GtrA family protein [Candidatus Saccharimonadales bacterium]|jgi:putative flippase GtrA|nr:GtrA family protein [Candidatus Saccharimonadales bacterium]
MIKKIYLLLDRPVGRYIIIGGFVYVMEIITILVAEQLKASAVVAVGISFWVGLIVSFILQKLVTFRDKRTQRQILLPQIAAFTLLVLFNFGFTLLVTYLLSPQVPAVFTRTIALGITTIWNFYLYKTRIFKKPDQVLID